MFEKITELEDEIIKEYSIEEGTGWYPWDRDELSPYFKAGNLIEDINKFPNIFSFITDKGHIWDKKVGWRHLPKENKIELDNIIEEEKEKLSILHCIVCDKDYNYKDYYNHICQKEDNSVNHPKHYTSHPSGIECIEITRHMSFNLGNAVKYLWRDGIKDVETPIQDLQKAIWYINDEINKRQKEGIKNEKI